MPKRYVPVPGGPINKPRLLTVLDNLAEIGMTAVSIGETWDGDILTVHRKLWRIERLTKEASLLAQQVLESVEHHEQSS